MTTGIFFERNASIFLVTIHDQNVPLNKTNQRED
jgi:hypothetical protein